MRQQLFRILFKPAVAQQYKLYRCTTEISTVTGDLTSRLYCPWLLSPLIKHKVCVRRRSSRLLHMTQSYQVSAARYRLRLPSTSCTEGSKASRSRHCGAPYVPPVHMNTCNALQTHLRNTQMIHEGPLALGQQTMCPSRVVSYVCTTSKSYHGTFRAPRWRYTEVWSQCAICSYQQFRQPPTRVARQYVNYYDASVVDISP